MVSLGNIKRSTLLIIGFIVIAIATLLTYFGVTLWVIWSFAIFAVMTAMILAFAGVFLLGLSRVREITGSGALFRSKIEALPEQLGDSVAGKMDELESAAEELLKLTKELTKIAKTNHVTSPKPNNKNKIPREEIEERLTCAIEEINFENRNLENIIPKLKSLLQHNSAQSQSGWTTPITTQPKSGKTGPLSGTSGSTNQPPKSENKPANKDYSGNSSKQNPDFSRDPITNYGDNPNFGSSFEEPTDAKVATVIEDYEKASFYPENQSYFMNKYSPIILDTQNASERLNNPDLKPIFTRSPQGSFMAIKTLKEDLFYIVPKFYFVLKDINYRTGAVNEVFDCQGYAAGFTFTKLRLIKPAVFNREGDGWAIKTPGVLQLGNGE